MDTTTQTKEAAPQQKTVPGQQMGLYCEADDRDVKQMVRKLNNPEEDSQDSRG